MDGKEVDSSYVNDTILSDSSIPTLFTYRINDNTARETTQGPRSPEVLDVPPSADRSREAAVVATPWERARVAGGRPCDGVPDTRLRRHSTRDRSVP